MQIRNKLTPLLLAVGFALSGMAIPMGGAHAQDTGSSEAGSASIELGNTSDAADQAGLAPEAGGAAPSSTDAAAEAKPPKEPQEAYRDLVIQQASEEPQGATSAVSRRYKKVDKATYNELLKSGALQPPQ